MNTNEKTEQATMDVKVLEALAGFPEVGLTSEGVIDHAFGAGCGQVERAAVSGSLRRLGREGLIERAEPGSCCAPLAPRYSLV